MMTIRDIASRVKAEIEGDASTQIRDVAKIEEASSGEISFLANPKYLKYLEGTGASAVIVGRKVSVPERPNRPVLLRVDDPYTAFLRVLLLFHPAGDPLPEGIHPTAVVDPSAKLGRDVRIGALAFVGERATIGDGAFILQGTVVGRDARIGAHALLYANVTVREECRIGERVIIHSGTVIGSDGFGFAPKGDGTYEKIPQLGIVVIGDDVEIGANCAVDRATLGETRIERGVKLDNLIQVAHNVVIGEHTVIAAQAGISGSTKIGKRNMIGGQVGFTGHLEIADDSKWGAQAGVHRSAKSPGGTYLGTPAAPFREASKIMGAWSQLPDALQLIHELASDVKALRQEIERLRKAP
ncbi:MAG TPA: UDP-3-O-(3-hydroxymyristoyl)glucosamine N-acyltransferase [Bacteroidota bacterium]|nr:UDP-3-O-(3-hydroxymyristoyl)glucosamine N-acyltransferase [Bacteroidota bacterium]